jgi:hypothetical protein
MHRGLSLDEDSDDDASFSAKKQKTSPLFIASNKANRNRKVLADCVQKVEAASGQLAHARRNQADFQRTAALLPLKQEDLQENSAVDILRLQVQNINNWKDVSC